MHTLTMNSLRISVARILFLLSIPAIGFSDLPPPDNWTEKNIAGWSAESEASGRIVIQTHSNQLIGQLATGITIAPGSKPATVTLSLGKAWDLEEADQLLFAWISMNGDVQADSYPQVTVWARNEIGEGFSRYKNLAVSTGWKHVRLDLLNPDDQDADYGAASRRGIERIDFTFPPSSEAMQVLFDDLHFETSIKLVLQRAADLGPLTERIRPERYAHFLSGSHLKAVQKPVLEALYKPEGAPPASPHRTWGTPLAGGPLRALFVVNLAFQREVVELAQRFDLDYDFVPLILLQRYKPEVMEDIARNRYDVIVTSALNINDQMIPFSEWLTGQVREGTGWVAINSGGDAGEIKLPFSAMPVEKPIVERWRAVERHPVVDGVPLPVLPPSECRDYQAGPEGSTLLVHGESGGARVMVAPFDKGRVVNLTSGFGNSAFSIIPRPLGDEHVLHHFDYWEYAYSLLAKAMWWASARAPGVELTAASLSPIRRSALKDAAITVQLRGRSGLAGDPLLEFTFRNTEGTVKLSGSQAVRIADGDPQPVQFSLAPGLPGGTYLLDAVVRNSAGQVLAWGAWIQEITHDISLAAVELDQEFYQREDAAKLKISLSNGATETPGTLRVEVFDSFGRLIQSEDSDVLVKAGESSLRTTIAIDGGRYVVEAYRVRVSFIDHEGSAAEMTTRMYVPIPPARKHETWWAGGTAGATHLHPHIYGTVAEVLKSMGLKAIATNGGYQHQQADLIIDNNLWPSPENIIWMGHWNQRFPNGIRTPCLSDPAVLADEVEKPAREFAAQYRKFGALGYASMEEVSLSSAHPNGTVCLGPHCRRGFVFWLRSLYPDLKALNTQWDTRFASWDEVEGLRWEDGAKDLANPSRWIDFRLFMEHVYAEMQRRFNETIRGADPGAYVGFNCGPYGENSFAGFNRALLGRDATFAFEYQPSHLEDRGVSTTLELLHGSAPHMRVGFWLGYNYMDLEPERYWFKTWWNALRNMYGPILYTIMNDASTFANFEYQKVHPTLAYNGFSSRTKDILSDLTRGTGKMLLSLERKTLIAVYHSEASLMRTYFESTRFPQAETLSVWDIRKLIREVDLDYMRLSTDQLLRGEANRYQVLVLSEILSLSDAEWDELWKFSNAGGSILAFARTGITDGHGKYTGSHARIQEILGVRYPQEKFSWMKDRIRGFSTDLIASVGGDVVTGGPVAAPDSRQVFATFADGSPSIIGHRLGNGSSIFCNFSSRMEPTVENRTLVSVLFNLLGMERSFRVRDGDNFPGGFQSFRYTRGEFELIGLLRTLGSKLKTGAQLQLHTERPAHVYDVLLGRYLGESDALSFKVPERGRPALFARLPYEIRSVGLTVPGTATRGDVQSYAVTIGGSGGAVADHFLRIEVFNPRGRRVEVLSSIVIALSGRYEGKLPFALNDPTGVWRVQVTDVVSGKKATREVRLAGAKVDGL